MPIAELVEDRYGDDVVGEEEEGAPFGFVVAETRGGRELTKAGEEAVDEFRMLRESAGDWRRVMEDPGCWAFGNDG